ncbi:MAG: MarR family winged helix-turn-helix transcriptional regulator [Paracoccaceae bacterium]
MKDDDASRPDLFRVRTGGQIHAGWLNRDLPFLVRSLSFLLRPESAELRAMAALEAGDIGVLSVVALNPGVNQNDLAASLVLKKSAITNVVQRLENRGLLRRQRSPHDRRANLIFLTEAGAELVAFTRTEIDRRTEDWFAGIDPDEREVFFSVLTRLIGKLASPEA